MTVRILHTADWHVGRRIRGRDRSDEHVAVLAEIAGIADRNEVDLTVISGDVFDTGSPSPTSEQIVYRALISLAETSRVLVVAGNHDNPKRLEAVAPLLEMGRVSVVGAPARPDEGGVIHLGDLGVKVAMLPFVSERGIVRVADLMQSDPDQHAGKYQDRVKLVIAALTEQMSTDTVNLLVGHLTVHGAVAGGGERKAHIFGYAVPTTVFPAHLSYVALGHLHRQQKMPHPGAVWYSGSPLQLDFGEEGDHKGVLMVEASPGLPSEVTSIPLESGKRLVVRRGSFDEVVAGGPVGDDEYVRVVLNEKARVGLAEAIRDAIGDVVDVDLEDSRRPTVAEPARQELEPTRAFHRYLEDKGVDDEALEELFAELLSEAVAE